MALSWIRESLRLDVSAGQVIYPSIFNRARNFVVRDSTFITVEKVTLAWDAEQERQALDLLRAKRMAGAEVDSSERYPPPRCHPATRKSIRESVTSWFTDDGRTSNMYWILGSAGVGKSAVAQTLAEEALLQHRLGAAFFFSRPNHRDDPVAVIPTIAHQLAIRLPQYKQLIVERLLNDPTMVEKDICSQFRLLIAEPFSVLGANHVSTHPILVIVDGLDECSDKEAQGVLIQLISDCARTCSALTWLNDPSILCICDELLVDGVEGRDDVYRFLWDGFAEIRRRYWEMLDSDWPPEDEVVQIARASSGHFAFASTAIDFIGANPPGNPVLRMQICLNVIDKLPICNINPLRALDLLYLEILSTIPSHVLPNTMKLLSLHFMLQNVTDLGYPSERTVLIDNANVLCLDKATVYAALRDLHSVLEVATAQQAHKPALVTFVAYAMIKHIPLSVSTNRLLEVKAAVTFISILWHATAILLVKDVVLHVFSAEWIQQVRVSRRIVPGETDIISRVTTGYIGRIHHFISPTATLQFRLGFIAVILLLAVDGLGPSAITADTLPLPRPTKIKIANLMRMRAIYWVGTLD
ncbi:hypothetical protein AN958_09746 [Leucoagaricus sp. SymC.cos]|nr:hypothetical protein AN958_09746 [Leucoagaricus sp. SymC.cos]